MLSLNFVIPLRKSTTWNILLDWRSKDICGLKLVSIKKLTFRSLHIMKDSLDSCPMKPSAMWQIYILLSNEAQCHVAQIFTSVQRNTMPCGRDIYCCQIKHSAMWNRYFLLSNEARCHVASKVLEVWHRLDEWCSTSSKRGPNQDEKHVLRPTL